MFQNTLRLPSGLWTSAACFSITMVTTYLTIWWCNPKDHRINQFLLIRSMNYIHIHCTCHQVLQVLTVLQSYIQQISSLITSEIVAVKLSLCMSWRHKEGTDFYIHSSTHSQFCHWMEMFSQLHTPAALLPMKESPIQLNWEMGRTHSQFACLEEGNNFLPLLQIEPQTIQPTAWSLYQLHYIDSFITSKTQVKKTDKWKK